MTILLESGNGLPSKRLRPSKTGSCSLLKTRTKAKDQEDVKGRCFLAGGCSPTELLRTWLPFLATASTPSSSSCPACPRPASRGVEVLFRADRRKSWCARAGTAPTPPPLGESITFPHLRASCDALVPFAAHLAQGWTGSLWSSRNEKSSNDRADHGGG